jgi:predicted RNase H-like HicB family nuclease
MIRSKKRKELAAQGSPEPQWWQKIGINSMIFHVTLEKDEDGWIVAECPALPGCVSQGKYEEEALKNIKEAITAWLWAEDQKAAAALPHKPGQQPIVVAV